MLDYLGRFELTQLHCGNPRDDVCVFRDMYCESLLFASSQGIAEGYTYDEFRDKYLEEYLKRDQDKYHYRYPGGEVSGGF